MGNERRGPRRRQNKGIHRTVTIDLTVMLYTRKGDNGTTKTFSCDQRISKSSSIAEALGTLDELNSFLGICKVKSDGIELDMVNSDFKTVADLLHLTQENLFIVQAQVAGAAKFMDGSKTKILEEIIDGIEKLLPPIKAFFIYGGLPRHGGGDELSA